LKSLRLLEGPVRKYESGCILAVFSATDYRQH